MIQDIAPHKLNNKFQPDRKPDDSSMFFLYRDGAVLARTTEDGLEFPTLADMDPGASPQHLIQLDDRDCFLIEEHPSEMPEGFRMVPMRQMREVMGQTKHLAYAALTGFQLFNWYRNNRFCGRCGNTTVRSKIERAMVCPKCTNTIYPRIVPAVIVAVTNGDEILLTKYARPGYTRYALIAGFTEIGETLEECVEREVMEEVGLKVKNIRYYKSQPWGIVDDLLVGYICDVDGDTTVRLDRNELKEGSWIKREDIPVDNEDYSMTNEIMVMFKNGKL